MINQKNDVVNLFTLFMPTFICHFILPGRVQLLQLLLLPRRVVALVATATSFLCAVVAEPPSCFSIPFFVPFPIISCSVSGVRGGDAGVWTSLSSDKAVTT